MRFTRLFTGPAKKAWAVFDDRTGLGQVLSHQLSHPVPNTTGWVGWSYAIGSAVLVAFILQVVTGVVLATAYVPSTEDAYDSLMYITDQATLGSFLRGLHNYGAWAMIIFIGLHVIQTYLVGAYKFPREANWLSGAVLLLLTLVLAFTGQLLRWDQTAYWSTYVLAAQVERTPIIGDRLADLALAGDTVGGATLTRFYAIHVFFVPALVFMFIGFHLWLVLHTGVSEPPQAGRPVDPKTYRAWYQKYLERNGVPFWPDAAWRDVVLGVGMVAAVAALAIIVGPPELENPPDPTVLQAYPRPDWYFLWIFAALAVVPPALEDLVILGAPAIFGALLVFLPFFANKGERSPKRRPWAIAIVMIAVIMVGTLYVAGERAPWSPYVDQPQLPVEVVVAPEKRALVAQGAQFYYQKGCQACHRMGNWGGLYGPNLTNVHERLSHEQIVISIINGRGGGMPAYAGNLTQQQVNAIVAFLEAEKVQRGEGEPPRDAGEVGAQAED